ncbi:MAG: response regulator transcription factor [Lachnospiraceae bacterium]|nr:response regulator transcription factor [Lachnospiraceae bacterium]
MVIGICDDEKKWREEEVKFCDIFGKINKIKFEYILFDSGEEILKYKDEIDILLLDVEMPGIDGIETKERLGKADNIKNILFISWLKDAVFDSFGDKTRGFLCKPLEYDLFSAKMKDIIVRVSDDWKKKSIEIYPENRSVIINVEDIIYVKGEGRYVKIVTADKEYTETKNLKYWEDRLKDNYIRRVHKSYLINYKYVEEIKNTYIKLKTIKETFPVSRTFFSVRKEEIREYRFEQFRRS